MFSEEPACRDAPVHIPSPANVSAAVKCFSLKSDEPASFKVIHNPPFIVNAPEHEDPSVIVRSEFHISIPFL
jgi:hypothetical protein